MKYELHQPEPPFSRRNSTPCIGYLVADPGVDFAKNEGCRIHVEHIVRGLRSAHYRVHFISVQAGEMILRELPTRPTIAGGKLDTGTKSVPRRLAAGLARRLCHWTSLPYAELSRSYRVYEVCLDHFCECDLVHERFALFSLGGVLAARRLGVPLILEVNAPLIDEAERLGGRSFSAGRKRLATLSARVCFSASALIVTVSAALRELLVSRWAVSPKKIHVLPNAADLQAWFVDEGRVRALRRQYSLNSGPVIVFVGALQPWHGLENLLEAFRLVVGIHPGAKLLVVGDGFMRERALDKTAALNMESSVVFTGNVAHSKVPEFLAASDIAVAPYPRLPLDFYFSPLKLFEYMAAGKAIVASRLGQIAEVIEHERNGLLVQPGDVRALGEAITRLIGDTSLKQRLGLAAQGDAARSHSWSAYIQRLGAIYDTALRPSEGDV